MDFFGPSLKRRLFSFSLAFAGAAALLQAQQPSGEIRLEVNDPSGAAVEASGRLRNPAGGVDLTFQTDAQGKYVIANLPYGRYRLELTKTGFVTQSSLIDVQSGTPISRTVTLAIGAQSSKVDVVAVTPLAGTDLTTDQIAGPVQTATAPERCLSQRNAVESIPARREFPRLHRFSAAWNARGCLGLSGRRASKPAIRRRGELGSDPQGRDLRYYAGAGIRPSVRPEHSGRRAVGPDEKRRRQSRP